MACLVLFIFLSTARADAAPREIVQFRLPNGLDVILERDDRQPRVAVLVGYDVGLRDDPPELRGLAHLVEHLTFRRSRHLPSSFAGAQLLQRAGASDLNGYTTLDYTAYQSVVPSGALELALYVESERMAFSLEKVDSAAMSIERDLVWRELRARAGSPTLELRRTALNVFFGEQHPYYQASPDSKALDSARLPQVRAFFQQHYRPDNAHLIIVGNVDLESARALVERYFGPIAPSALPRPVQRKIPRHAAARSFVLRKPTSIEQMGIYWPMPDPASEQGLATLLYGQYLGRRLGDILLKSAPASSRLAYAQSAFDLGALFAVRLSTRSGDLERSSRLLESELRRTRAAEVRRHLPELVRRVLFEAKLRRESLLAVAEDHLRSTRSLHRPFDFEGWGGRLAQLRDGQIEQAAKWFRGDRAVLGWLLDADTPAERAAPELSVVSR